MKKNILFLIITVIIFTLGRVCAEEPQGGPLKDATGDDTAGFAGEFFDTKVPLQNYIFVKDALTVFSNRGGATPKTDEEKEDNIWDQLLLSYEAFRGNIAVAQEEVDTEVSNILAEYKVDFDWKTNKEAFQKWVKEKAGEPAELFENQIRHLLQIEKLRRQITESIQPPVTEEEARQDFLNEYNSLSVELVTFDTKEEAEDFYRQVKARPKLWDEKKEKSPDAFRRPGLVSIIFLMDIWKFPQDAAYGMMKMKKGEFFPPAPLYKGYAVFQVLDTRPASEADFEKVKARYFDRVKKRKQYEGYNNWFRKFKEEAKIKIYPNKGGQVQ